MLNNLSNPLTVFALGCHPDDIEFMMGGTLFVLKELGFEIHYMNLANGNCGTMKYSKKKIVKIRAQEAQTAAKLLGATWYPSLYNDMEITYQVKIIKKILSIMRKIQPDIVLIPSLKDYMEDHMNTARIAVSAAFALPMINFSAIPPIKPVSKEIALYHAMPYGLHDGLSEKIKPHFYIDISKVIDKKEAMLACHESQRIWLDKSQKQDSYLQTARDMSKQMGIDSKKYEFAEGWIRHNPLGYSSKEFAPLENVANT